MELVEHLARITVAARALGGAKKLEPSLVAKLASKGRPKSTPCFGSAPAPASSGAPRDDGRVGRPDVQTLVQDALRRFQ